MSVGAHRSSTLVRIFIRVLASLKGGLTEIVRRRSEVEQWSAWCSVEVEFNGGNSPSVGDEGVRKKKSILSDFG